MIIEGDQCLSGTLAGSVVRYFAEMCDRDPRLAAIGSELMRSDLTDIEQAMLLNQFKTIAAHITYADLKKWGVVDDSLIMSGLDRQFVVQKKEVQFVEGQRVEIPELVCDMVVLKDRQGNEFAYPVGVSQKQVLISAVEASKVVQELPAYLRKGIERVSFYNTYCRADKYWKLEYKNPSHVSAATDGGKVSFWEVTRGMSKEQFKVYLSHEAAHILDSGHKYSNMSEWRSVMSEDAKLAANGKAEAFPTEYAATNACEDFAESMMMFLNDRKKLKEICPNREHFLHELTKRLGKR